MALSVDRDPQGMSVVHQELRFPASDAGIELGATETRPATGQALARVLLVAGSGPQDRDQTVDGRPTFLYLRTALAAAGFAALSYDRRGVGGSGGDYFDGDSAREIEDLVTVAARWRSTDPDLPLFLLGHSQGGWFALEGAARIPKLAGLVLLATSGRPGRETLETQHRRICAAEGWDEEPTEDSLSLKQACFDILATRAERLSTGERARLREELQACVDAFHSDRGVDPQSVRDDLDRMIEDLMEWEWRYLLRFDPASSCAAIELPVWIASGTLDLQIESSVDPERLAKLIGPTWCTKESINGADHLFRVDRSSTADPRPMDESMTDPLIEWMRETIEGACKANPLSMEKGAK